MVSKKSKAERVIEQINATNAKKVALVLVIGFVCYHELLHLRYGSNSCSWLLSDGRYKGNQEWQPYGCMLHLYSKIDTRRCLRYLAFYGKDSNFVFIGDSRIRQLYVSFVKHLQQQEDDATEPPAELETNLLHEDNKLNIKVQFFWSPTISKRMVEKFREWKKQESPPSVVIVGCGWWSIKTSNASSSILQEYSSNLTYLVQPIDEIHKKESRVLWVLQEPVNSEKLKLEFQMITNEQIDLYNKAAIEVLSHSAAELWWSARLVAQGMVTESPDGLHLANRPLRHITQILLNMYCNDYMNFNDGTCCSSAESYTTLQIVTFAILTVCVLIFLIILLHRWISKCRGAPLHEYTLLNDLDPNLTSQYTSTTTILPNLSTGQPLTSTSIIPPPPPTVGLTTLVPPPGDMYHLFKALTTMTLILAYFLVCDRTNFFMKENKYYSEFSFWLPVGYICALGLFFTEDSKYTRVLHRDQIDEWRGWMQLVILVYHVTGASQILPINLHMKALISAYLFLLGHQHFCHVWQRGDVTLVTFFRNLFQLNFMTVTLCLCMNRPYQFYYFVPLISFWYMMIYAFLVLPPVITAQTSENHVQYLYLVIKFVIMVSVITVLFMSEVFFEKVFVTRPWKALFVTTDDDIHEWWSRWKLDRYSTVYGMLFGVLIIISQKYNLFDDNHRGNLFSRGISLTFVAAAVIALGSYITFTCLCLNEADCAEIHSYIAFLPILAYIVLRNISGILRTKYSSFFAWFGSISLELFISQYHIWLAADTHGVLVLIPGYPVLNLIVTSYIFVCASHEVHRLTKVLLPYAVPPDYKLVLRNFMLFLAVLVPIGINDGMF